jgi:pimeloyl-ACP methyl ester carboxylesterase
MTRSQQSLLSIRSNLMLVAILFSLLTPASAAGAERPELHLLVDVGGYKLYINCIGNGPETVVLEAGLGGSSDGWVRVMPEVGKFTRVCTYDRPSEGKSDPAPRSLRHLGTRNYIELRTGADIVRDLHTLLINAGEKPPYVMVGHSIGGLYTILYASKYPQEVVGMVLEDSSHPDQLVRRAAITGPERAKRDHESLMQNEEGVDADAILAEVRTKQWHSDIPLYVLASGLDRQPPAGWSPEQWKADRDAHMEMQEDHARRSPRSKLIVAEKSGHFIHRDQPELVIDAIRQVVALVDASPAKLSK